MTGITEPLERHTVGFLRAGSPAVLFEWSGPARSSDDARRRALADLPVFWTAACHGRGGQANLPFDPATAILQTKRHDHETQNVSWGAHDETWSALPERRADAALIESMTSAQAWRASLNTNHKHNGYPFCGTVRVAVFEGQNRIRRQEDGAMDPVLRQALMAVLTACAASPRYYGYGPNRMKALWSESEEAPASATLRAARVAQSRAAGGPEDLAHAMDAMGLADLAVQIRSKIMR